MNVTGPRVVMTVAAAIGLVVVGGGVGADADPPAFPDLAGYAPVNVADFTIEVPSGGRGTYRTVVFLTPDGITCRLVNSGAECAGNNLPGVAPNTQTSPQGIRGQNSVRTDIGLQPTGTPITYGDNVVQGHPIRTLPPLHSIAADGAICGVDDAGTTACKDAQGRGFVLSPQLGTIWLPHV